MRKQALHDRRRKDKYSLASNNSNGNDDLDLTEEEIEKILEVLLSQFRVLTVLYEKTFPNKSNTGESAGEKRSFKNVKE
jgi:hypothetical protein